MSTLGELHILPTAAHELGMQGTITFAQSYAHVVCFELKNISKPQQNVDANSN